MSTDAYRAILERLVQSKGAQTHGFRRSLRSLVYDDEYEFVECFGKLQAKPACYRIDPPDERGWDQLHIWEISLQGGIQDWKLNQYGRIADGAGPITTLHIVGGYGQKISVTNDFLQCLAFAEKPRKKLAEYFYSHIDTIEISSLLPTVLLNEHTSKSESKPRAKLNLQQRKNAAFIALKELGIEI